MWTVSRSKEYFTRINVNRCNKSDDILISKLRRNVLRISRNFKQNSKVSVLGLDIIAVM